MPGTLKILLGLGVAVAAQVMALGLAGGGHGWITPFWCSIGLWLLLPAGFYFSAPIAGYPPSQKRAVVMLIVIAIASDLVLIQMTLVEGVEWFWKAWNLALPVTLSWILMFLSWQVTIAFTLARGARPFPAA